MIPGNESPELHFVDPARTRQPFSGVMGVDVTFSPSGRRLHGRGSYTQLDSRGPWVLELDDLPSEFLDRFAEASSISLRTGSRQLGEMATPQAGAAIRALRQCNDALLRNWGIDPDAAAGLQRQPEIIGQWYDLFRGTDYPEEAVRQGISGISTVRITVGTNGRISDCTVLVSSGNASLDRTTCNIFRERARLHPGLDRDGHPVAVNMIKNINWLTLPRLELLNHN